MLKYFFSNDDSTTPVDSQLDAVLSAMDEKGVDSEEYPTLLSYMERLNKVKTEVSHSPVSRDTIALIIGNLFGILLIVAYEQKHVMMSKGFSQIIRPKGT